MNWLEIIGLVCLASLGQKMCFSRKNVSFRRSLNVLNCFKCDSNSGFWGFLVVASIYQTIKYCCAEETGQVLKIWLRSSVFLWKLAFFCLRATILSFFMTTWGNIYWFLVVFLDVNRWVCICKRVHTKSEPTGISSSRFASCLNEVSVSPQSLFFFA